MTNQIYPCLWFDGQQAKPAADFYCEVFPNSKILSTNPFVVIFELNGKKFMGLNGGPEYKFNEAVSFVVNCETQEEIDYYWNKLTKDGEEGKCGCLKDKYGVSWQIVPSILGKLMSDPEKAPKVMYAFMQMKKFDIEKLMQA
jgi:predicted 3-demethylubiquinone-9 3-methyltransferase (glyoxalase superfamily)